MSIGGGIRNDRCSKLNRLVNACNRILSKEFRSVTGLHHSDWPARQSSGETSRALLRALSGFRDNAGLVSTTPNAFDEQLKICREEYRRRHPKSLSRVIRDFNRFNFAFSIYRYRIRLIERMSGVIPCPNSSQPARRKISQDSGRHEVYCSTMRSY
jgi:hypothetical protein